MRWLQIGLSCYLVLAGCGGEGTGASASDAAVDGGAICQDLTRQASDYVATHQSCNLDGDCTGEAAFGFIYDTGTDVSCWPAVAISTDASSGFLSLMNQMFAARCTGPTRTCSALVPVPRCNQHVCTYP
jgi:hypothetical protein